jgi:riboflavin synthase
MFTGIIEEVGTVARIVTLPAADHIEIRCRTVLEQTALGSSIAVSGVCLTVVAITRDSLTADVSPETLRRSTLGSLRSGSPVNLERPLSASARLGGHLVQGHVDGTGELLALDQVGDGNWWLTVQVPQELDRYVVEKGSIAIDGISLTVASIEAGRLAATIVPHTYASTSLGSHRPGDRVNLECDILAKYVEKLLGTSREAKPSLTMEKLRELGY